MNASTRLVAYLCLAICCTIAVTAPGVDQRDPISDVALRSLFLSGKSIERLPGFPRVAHLVLGDRYEHQPVDLARHLLDRNQSLRRVTLEQLDRGERLGSKDIVGRDFLGTTKRVSGSHELPILHEVAA